MIEEESADGMEFPAKIDIPAATVSKFGGIALDVLRINSEEFISPLQHQTLSTLFKMRSCA